MDALDSHEDRRPPLHYLPFIFVALLVGVFSGLAAIFIRQLISLLHNLFFYGVFSDIYQETIPTPPSSFGPWIILMPVIGAFFVTLLIKEAEPESKGFGVPNVMYSIHYAKGKISVMGAFIKSVCACITIGSGGSAGREGPIIQLGGSIGSFIGQIFKLSVHQRCILVAAGAASGIATTFNAPIGGLVFAIELLLVSINALSIGAVATATITATLVGYYFYGLMPVLTFPELSENYSFSGLLLSSLGFLPLGILIGIASYLFIETLYIFSKLYNKMIKHPFVRHMLAMFIEGMLLYFMLVYFGFYYVEGLGFSVIQSALAGDINTTSLFFIIFLAKLIATALTLGSGGSGGSFLPSLVMGACLGGGYGALFNSLFPHLHVSQAIFISSGIGGMLSGTIGAVMTAIVIVPELTNDFYHAVPNMITVIMAYGVRTLLIRQSIYTVMLHRSGIKMPYGLRGGMLS